jgi:hypothetical protein
LMTANIFASRSNPVLGRIRTGFLTVGVSVLRVAAFAAKTKRRAKRPALCGGYGDPDTDCQEWAAERQ